ncbi:hypothetical protein [Vibrio sp. D431a]|uniref:hypothetical protein n=1 Tax=Vibrio sp. D431a TaxID=2837388 RepID=UPI0025559EAD|nr:hypothetical protein [Vibrio sp. D431a]MDK9790004.1 hypothetical protein [Vibrio sp. D431a]
MTNFPVVPQSPVEGEFIPAQNENEDFLRGYVKGAQDMTDFFAENIESLLPLIALNRLGFDSSDINRALSDGLRNGSTECARLMGSMPRR